MDHLTVILKSKEHKYSHKFPVTSLDTITLSHDDKTLQRMVEEAQRNCTEQAEEISIKINFIW